MNTRSRLCRAPRAFHGRENGQIVILAAFFLVIGLSFAAIVIDVGRFMHGRQQVQNAVDAAALAAAQELPDHGSTAQTIANQYLDANDPDLDAAQKSITFRCIVGDRDHNGQPDATDIPAVCNPGAGAHFTCHGDICVSPCDFSGASNKCNTVVVGANKDVPFLIAPIFNMFQASTGNVRAAACRGACGGPPTIPVDLVVIIDRTSSMSSSDVTNARNAANAILSLYNPARSGLASGYWALAAPAARAAGHRPYMRWPLPQPRPPTRSQLGPDWPERNWSAYFNEAYVNASGTPVASSHLEKGITCFNTSSTGTDLASPVTAAANYLRSNGRSTAKKGIILETDGSPNGSTCLAAYNAAQAAKTGSPPIEIFTIGFGLTTSDKCPDTSGSYKNKSVVQLLADMATSSINNGCVDAENTDGDHFFCLPKTSQLASIFQIAAANLAAGCPTDPGSRLTACVRAFGAASSRGQHQVPLLDLQRRR